jgi:hypothetical protein
MTDRSGDAETRRMRGLCYLAAGVFAACAVALLFLPAKVAPPVKWVLAGFNAVIAFSVVLYGRSLTRE